MGDVRGAGLIGAVELVKDKDLRQPFSPQEGVGAYCAAACQEEGLIVRNMGDAMAFCPPLIINEDQVDELVSKFAKGLERTHAWVS